MKKEFETFWEIGKSYTFESSHTVACQTLPPFKCRDSIHGHSYQMTISISGSKLFNSFILDYGEIDEIMKPEIDKLDYAFMIGKMDKNTDYAKFIEDTGFRVYELNVDYPTAELIAKHFAEFIFEKLKEKLPENQFRSLIKIMVEVKETQKTYARYTIYL